MHFIDRLLLLFISDLTSQPILVNVGSAHVSLVDVAVLANSEAKNSNKYALIRLKL